MAVNTAPDGDTLQFMPDSGTQTQMIWGRLRWSSGRSLTVRLYGIDAPEIHYHRRGYPVVRQPYPWGESAAQYLLKFLGFQGCQYSIGGRLVEGYPSRIPGMLGLMQCDRHGRAVGLASRETLRATTSSIAAWENSANLHLIRSGAVWPLFHGAFPSIWMPSLLQALHEARLAKRGIWRDEITHKGFPYNPKDWPLLQQTLLIWPFLFRRLADAQARILKYPNTSLLWQLGQVTSRVTLRSSNCSVRFTDLIDHSQHYLQLLVAPEEIIFSS